MEIFKRNPSFMEIYDHVLSRRDCERLIELFETYPQYPGRLHAGDGERIQNETIKKTTEIIVNFNDQSEISKIVLNGLYESINKYHKKYHGALELIPSWRLMGGYNFQKYETEEDGYKVWHTEHVPGGLNRIFVWMIYLNDAKSGTDFMYYPTIKSKAGRCVIWPSGWTHLHKSQKNNGLKYIVTGWVGFT